MKNISRLTIFVIAITFCLVNQAQALLPSQASIILSPNLNNQALTNHDLTLNFSNLFTKLTKSNRYWLKWQKTNRFSKKHTLKAWKITTNLNKYKAAKKRLFKIKAVFKYSDSEFKTFKKKNKNIKESQIQLQYRTKKGSWQPVTKHWQSAKIKHNKKKNTFTISYITSFSHHTYYFAIRTTSAYSWNAVESGMNNMVYALAVYNNELYVGGLFTSAGSSPGDYIAKWNGSSWSAVGSGMNSYVYALTVYNNQLYAGGEFTNAGGNPANYIASWDSSTSTWSALGSETDSKVFTLTVYNNQLYAGGEFTNAGGNPANYIASWDGSSWSALGSGVDGTGGLIAIVQTLAVYNNELYVGGNLTTAGGIPVSYIAKWDGSNWTSVDTGVSGGAIGGVLSFLVYNNKLYVGGDFTTAGGIEANYIASWDGSSWSAVGTGMGGGVLVSIVMNLAVYNNQLYAGGFFATAGGNPANAIASWNGSSWSAVGTGLGGGGGFLGTSARTLAVYNNELYVGGDFNTAGGISAPYIAKWTGDTTAPTTTASPAGGTYETAQTVTLTAADTDSGVAATYYTTDNTTPSSASAAYSSPITISTTTTLKFFSVDNAGNEESIKTEEYIIETTSPTPQSPTPQPTTPQPILFNHKLNLNNVQKNQIYYSAKTNTRLIFFALPSFQNRQDLYIKVKRIKHKYLPGFKKSRTYPDYIKLTSNIKKAKNKHQRIKFRLKINYSKKKLKANINLKPKKIRVYHKDTLSDWYGPYNTYQNQPIHRLRVSLQNYHRPQSLAASTKVLYFPNLIKIKFVLAKANAIKSEYAPAL